MDDPFFKKNLSGTTPFLIRISHPNMDGDMFLTNNNKALTYEGQEYTPYKFDITLPDMDGDSMGQAKLSISVIDRKLIRLIRSLSTYPTLTFMASYQEKMQDFLPLERGVLSMGNVTYNASQMDAELTLDTVLLDEFPSIKMTPVVARGIA